MRQLFHCHSVGGANLQLHTGNQRADVIKSPAAHPCHFRTWPPFWPWCPENFVISNGSEVIVLTDIKTSLRRTNPQTDTTENNTTFAIRYTLLGWTGNNYVYAKFTTNEVIIWHREGLKTTACIEELLEWPSHAMARTVDNFYKHLHGYGWRSLEDALCMRRHTFHATSINQLSNFYF